MGGYGSGRWGWHSKKTTVEDGLTLSVRALRDTFRQRQPWCGSIVWTNVATGQQTSSIGYDFWPNDQAGRLRLYYTTTRPGGEKIKSDYWMDLETTPCNLGGVRWWFVCPLVRQGRPCRRRCGKLYLPPGALTFGCRECYGLTYTSCQEAHRFDGLFASVAADTGRTPAQVKRAMNRLSRWN